MKPDTQARVDGRWTGLVLQPISRLISEEQLYTEVDSIYTGLTRIESKCMHFYSTQRMMLAPAQWLALAGLHRALLCEHHDFFLASHHPSASTALRDRAMEYSMPARMWNHGIYSFLDLLRQYLPESLEHLLAFTSLAYQMITFLYEAVPAFECTWVKYLGELARYRMEIAGEDRQDRETWAAIAHLWHLRAADKGPSVGHLCHH
ncbi:hypothetical protein B0J12DRAFT_710232 [Macrophomina phaseolina]|uniref:Uncharacterized protein n=1 Tax=Macrophomina phaseolina TaxID=35725 RepID=A0ABQ8GHN1_9PEZI|nr:hypothetical protein B0J12DRAFT_710232 [Macrophomina phaseolina]